jgi:CubicO group peptidase (beta-lactamase class C family)
MFIAGLFGSLSLQAKNSDVETAAQALLAAGRYHDPGNFAAHPPETQRQYSNVAYGLAGYLVEVLSGEPLNRFSANRIFKPLGMTATGWLLSEIDTSQHALLYEWGEEGSDPGVATRSCFNPDTGAGAILLVNTSSESDAFGLAVRDMFRALLKASIEEH